ncbi:MAG: phosphoesterase [Gammaproteobacteria bacterium]|nr:phosphoesterase [Gammaproteobacteria bacterium]
MSKKPKSQVYFLADNHFGHENIIKYCNRPFSSVGEMDSVMIERWNWAVRPKDIVYHLGDFCLGNQETAFKYFKRLNGRIYVVPGGHDKRWIRPNLSYTGPNCVVRVLPPLYTITLNEQIIVLCHYCMRVWPKSHYGSWQLYGHSHGGLPSIGKQMDVGVDTNSCFPYSLERIEEIMEKQSNNFNLVKKGKDK